MTRKFALLIADYASKITADFSPADKLETIRIAIDELRAMHEQISDDAAAAAILLSGEYFEKNETNK